jgi:hypothetical protein
VELEFVNCQFLPEITIKSGRSIVGTLYLNLTFQQFVLLHHENGSGITTAIMYETKKHH